MNFKTIVNSTVSAFGSVAFSFVSDNKIKKAVEALPQGFTVTGHSGCERTPDNSIEAFEAGYKAGASILEFDLNFDKSGKPVLSHDKPKGECVTLHEAFAYFAENDKLKVNVDVKNTKDLKAVLESAKKFGIEERIFYTGITEKDVEAVKHQTPEVKYFLNHGVDKAKKCDKIYIESLADKVERLGAVGINLNYHDCSKELVEHFHSRGLQVSLWTVNNKYAMYKVMMLSPDNITTRFPSDLTNIINNHK